MPERNGRAMWEMLALESFQAGLSWITILRKRAAFRGAFAGFDPDIVGRWGEGEVGRLLDDASIVRHRGKIEATIGNARAYLRMEEEKTGGFSAYLWGFVDGIPLQPFFERIEDIPTQTILSQRISRDLKTRGFRFCGPTIVYAFLQATGVTNDHLTSCFRHGPVMEMGRGEQSMG